MSAGTWRRQEKLSRRDRRSQNDPTIHAVTRRAQRSSGQRCDQQRLARGWRVLETRRRPALFSHVERRVCPCSSPVATRRHPGRPGSARARKQVARAVRFGCSPTSGVAPDAGGRNSPVHRRARPGFCQLRSGGPAPTDPRTRRCRFGGTTALQRLPREEHSEVELVRARHRIRVERRRRNSNRGRTQRRARSVAGRFAGTASISGKPQGAVIAALFPSSPEVS